jgi:hypothetical protein
MADKMTKEHWSKLLGILIIVGIFISVFYGYIVTLNNKHKVAECEEYARGKYSVSHDDNLLDNMLDKCTQ